MGPPKATKVNKYQAKCPRGMRAVRHLRALAERARPPCRIGSLKTNHAHPSRKLRQLDRLVDGIRESSRRPWQAALGHRDDFSLREGLAECANGSARHVSDQATAAQMAADGASISNASGAG